ncbi:hypothetical protein UFOVP626_54 [uncultured Caudovirales phage]|uniref:Uncharacterized protein n=1 Tax=uncultured Caudovirales phage TaxID=2100421 RepID=A0A6J5N3D5_9CAUD|nr:hypothetical protein UFOVP626_54 [uncultured Caudovirales phage]CAB4173342.1 hypothetical protein UFOVP951_49 [uncultured Caudovirales phage]CAB4184840.1 hypothetical protein UFOVP1115_42 [uncultured Caudovirales phage]CAB5238433.1 hypothetical protein UFOVP1567_41 [uncultured Caudovirales phage]
MSKVMKEVSCIVGEYRNSEGQTKKRYQRIGSVIETKNGPMLKLDVIPLREGGWDGWAFMNDPKPQDERRARQSDQPDDDIPF